MSAKVLKDGTVLSFDDATDSIHVLPKASILLIDDRIAAIEADYGTLSIPDDAEIINVAGKIVSPGFINTHFHAWQSLCRTIGPNTTLIEYFGWVCGITPLVPDNFTPDDVYIGSLQGYLEGLHGGVTTFVDHAHHNWSLDAIRPGYDGAVDGGARVYWCYDINSRRPNCPADEQWEVFEQIAQDNKSSKSTVTLGLGYDGSGGTPEGQDPIAFAKEKISSVSPFVPPLPSLPPTHLFLSRTLNLQALTCHHLGGPWPGGPHNSPSSLSTSDFPSLSLPLIISHAGFLTPDDLLALRTHDMNISVTPESEYHYGHGQTTSHLLASHTSLGVDTNWTFSGDILTQARIWLQATRNKLYEGTLNRGLMPGRNPVTVEQAFLMATRQGGLALRREDLGVLKVGAKADLVVFEGDGMNMLGWSDAVAAVLLHANVGDIRHVIVDGEWRKRDFEMVVKEGVKGGMEGIKKRFLEATRRLHPVLREGAPGVGGQLWGQSNIGEVQGVELRR